MSIPCERSQCITAVPVVPAVFYGRFHLDGYPGSWAIDSFIEVDCAASSGYGSDMIHESVVLGHTGSGLVCSNSIHMCEQDDDGDSIVLLPLQDFSDTVSSSRSDDRGPTHHILAVNQDVCQTGNISTLPEDIFPCLQREGHMMLHSDLPSSNGTGGPVSGSRIIDESPISEDVIINIGTSYVPVYHTGCDVPDIGIEDGDERRMSSNRVPALVIPTTASIILRRYRGDSVTSCNNLYRDIGRNVK